MHLVYIDDSYEKPYQIYAAIAVPATRWAAVFTEIKEWRRALKKTDGILITKEFHATEFCAGRGRLGPYTIGKYRRAQIFNDALKLLDGLEGVKVFTVCHAQNREWALERLLTRMNKTLGRWDSHATLFFDEGKELEITRMMRRMGVYNPVPVYIAKGITELQNLKLDRILEDPVFKESDQSYLIQMADFVAYALLRKEVRLASKDKYGYHTAFYGLQNVLAREASTRDALGIIR